MIGDVNLFFHAYIEENEAEIDIMIAEENFRRKGIAQQVSNIIMDFGFFYKKIDTYFAKIK